MPTVGGLEWAWLVVILVLLFGAKKLPELGSSVGKSIKNFKNGMAEAHEEDETQPRTPSKTPEQ